MKLLSQKFNGRLFGKGDKLIVSSLVRNFVPEKKPQIHHAASNRISYSNAQSASHLNTQAENLNRTIHLLADRTNPISVDNFYYLIDQMDPQDGIPYTNALDLAKYFLETGQSCLAKFGKTCNPSDLRSLHSVFFAAVATGAPSAGTAVA